MINTLAISTFASGKSNYFDSCDDRGRSPMVPDDPVFICHKPSPTAIDYREAASGIIADEYRYMKTSLKESNTDAIQDQPACGT